MLFVRTGITSHTIIKWLVWFAEYTTKILLVMASMKYINIWSQNNLIDQMTEFISSMRVHGKTSLLPFQKGKNINIV